MVANVLHIYGTRPEAIKLAPLIKQIQTFSDMSASVVVTGQHREMLDQVNELFGIQPDYDLNVIQPGQTLTDVTSRVILGLDVLFKSVRPDVVVVQGDTTSSLAGALAAFYQKVPVVHLEAGLRSHDLALPFPEEGNRKLISQISTLHLAPTGRSRLNLLREGIHEKDIAVTGNTVIDALLEAKGTRQPYGKSKLEQLVSSGQRILLVTSHRRENLGAGMDNIGRALARISERLPAVSIVFPIHRNPAVREAILPHIAGRSNVLVTEPLQYREFVQLLSDCHLVLTDSGGIQEEAPALGKPVLVMRTTTERPEAVAAGVARLVGTVVEDIVDGVVRLFEEETSYLAMSKAINPYGDGHASERSVAAIRNLLGLSSRNPDFEPA